MYKHRRAEHAAGQLSCETLNLAATLRREAFAVLSPCNMEFPPCGCRLQAVPFRPQ